MKNAEIWVETFLISSLDLLIVCFPDSRAATMSKVDDTVLQVHPDDGNADGVVGEKDGTNRDVADMQRMGKQQLFRVLIACALTCIC